MNIDDFQFDDALFHEMENMLSWDTNHDVNLGMNEEFGGDMESLSRLDSFFSSSASQMSSFSASNHSFSCEACQFCDLFGCNSCNPADTKNKRRKRIQRDNWMIVPRVVKSDIRRLYAQMFVNILNSQDINLLRSFLRTYASKSITLSTVCSCGKNPFSANLRGRDLITCLSAAQFQVSPDRIHAIDNVQIISNSANRECKIRCNVSSTFTILFTITLENIIEQITKTFHPQTIDQTIPNGSVNISSKTMSMPDNPRREIGTLRSSQDFYDIFRCFPGGASSVLARTPRVLACTMKMVLDVDENKQIKFITLAH